MKISVPTLALSVSSFASAGHGCPVFIYDSDEPIMTKGEDPAQSLHPSDNPLKSLKLPQKGAVNIRRPAPSIQVALARDALLLQLPIKTRCRFMIAKKRVAEPHSAARPPRQIDPDPTLLPAQHM